MDEANAAEIFLNAVAQALDVDPASLSLQSDRTNTEEWDSIGNLKIFLLLEEQYQVQFTPEEIETLSSLEAIFYHLKGGSAA